MLTKIYKPREFDKERGFTLIELLVVIVIIGILAAVALPIFLGQQNAARAATVKSDARNSVINVRDALVTQPEAAGFTILHPGDTATYALIPSVISTIGKTANVTVPTGNAGVYVVQSANNLTVITDVAHAGSNALTTLSSASPDWTSWVVHSENTLTGYWYEFDSTTGRYTDGTHTPVGGSFTPAPTANGGGSSSGGGGTSGNPSGSITATTVDYGGANSYVAFDSPVTGNTSLLPWAVGKDLSQFPSSANITNLHVYVASTEVAMNTAIASNWFMDAYDYGAGTQIEYYTTPSDLNTDITAAGFTMAQFFTTGKIVATVDGIPNNIMFLNITGLMTTSAPPEPGYPGGTSGSGGSGGGAQPASFSTLTTDHGNVCTNSTDIIAPQESTLVSAPNAVSLTNTIERRGINTAAYSGVSPNTNTLAQIQTLNGPDPSGGAGSWNWNQDSSTVIISVVTNSGGLLAEPTLASAVTASSTPFTSFVWDSSTGLSYGHVYFTASGTFSAAQNTALDLLNTNGGAVSYIDTTGNRVSFTLTNSVLWGDNYLSNVSKTATTANAKTYCAGVIDTKIASNSYGNSFYLEGYGKFNYTDALNWELGTATNTFTSWNSNASDPSHLLDLYYWDSSTSQLVKFYTDTSTTGLCTATVLYSEDVNQINSELNCNTADPTIVANLKLMAQNGGALSFVDPVTGKRIQTYIEPASSTTLPSWVGSSPTAYPNGWT